MSRHRAHRISANARSPYASLHFDNRRHCILAMENGLAGYVHAQPEYEVARGRWQPMRLVTGRSGVLNVNVDRTIGIRLEARTIADAVAIDRVWHKMVFRTTHSQRPEGLVRWKPA